VPESIRQLPVDSPIAQLLGAKPLRPEKSKNYSLGVTYEEGSFSGSVDFYRVVLDNQILLSSNFASTSIPALVQSYGFPSVESVAYFANAANSERQGVDLTLRYRLDLRTAGILTATLSGTQTESKFLWIEAAPSQLTSLGITTPLLDLTQQTRLLAAQPKDKYSLDLDWAWRKLSVNLRNTLYGSFQEVQFTSLTAAQVAVLTPGYDVRLEPTAPASANYQVIQIFQPRVITDLDVTYRFTRRLSVSLGTDNLLNVYPTKNIPSTVAGVAAGSNGADNVGTIPYPNLSPYGFNGTFYYGKVRYAF
jgi:iron complex outermembrane receptor protein